MKPLGSAILLAALLSCAMTACVAARPGATEPWLVLDVSADPARPIAGAKVLAILEGTSAGLGHPTHGCHRAWYGETDGEGVVRIPATPTGTVFTSFTASAIAYKRGFRPVRSGERFSIAAGWHLIRLVPVQPEETIEARMKDLEAYANQSRCNDPDTRLQLVEFMRAILPEVRDLERTEGKADPLVWFEYHLWYQENSLGIAQGPEPKPKPKFPELSQPPPRATIEAQKVQVLPNPEVAPPR